MSPWLQALILACALVVGLGISAALLIAAGVKPSALFDEFIVENFSDPENLHSILFQAAPLIFVGVSAALAFRVRFWNLGIEGQMIWGGIAATAVSFYDIGPPATRLPLMMLFAALAGMAWIIVPLWLRVRWRVNEIIVTLLLNYVAFNFLLHLLYGAWLDPKDNFPALTAIPRLRAAAGTRLRHQQRAGAGADFHRAEWLARYVHAVRLLHEIRA